MPIGYADFWTSSAITIGSVPLQLPATVNAGQAVQLPSTAALATAPTLSRLEAQPQLTASKLVVVIYRCG